MHDICFFPVIETVVDNLNQKEEVESYSRQVFCEKKSVPQSEFFAAGQSGIKPSAVLIVHTFDYQEEVKVKYKTKTYQIYRTFERDDEKIELYCEVRAGG